MTPYDTLIILVQKMPIMGRLHDDRVTYEFSDLKNAEWKKGMVMEIVAKYNLPVSVYVDKVFRLVTVKYVAVKTPDMECVS